MKFWKFAQLFFCLSFSGERKIEGTRKNTKHKNWAPDVFLRSPPPPPRLSKEQKLARGVIVVNKAKQRKIRKASSSSSSKSTLDDSGQSKFNFKKYLFFVFFARNLMNWKEYFPNLLESILLHHIFVYWVRDSRFWLLAYLILLNCAKLSQIGQTWYLYIYIFCLLF